MNSSCKLLKNTFCNAFQDFSQDFLRMFHGIFLVLLWHSLAFFQESSISFWTYLQDVCILTNFFWSFHRYPSVFFFRIYFRGFASIAPRMHVGSSVSSRIYPDISTGHIPDVVVFFFPTISLGIHLKWIVAGLLRFIQELLRGFLQELPQKLFLGFLQEFLEGFLRIYTNNFTRNYLRNFAWSYPQVSSKFNQEVLQGFLLDFFVLHRFLLKLQERFPAETFPGITPETNPWFFLGTPSVISSGIQELFKGFSKNYFRDSFRNSLRGSARNTFRDSHWSYLKDRSLSDFICYFLRDFSRNSFKDFSLIHWFIQENFHGLLHVFFSRNLLLSFLRISSEIPLENPLGVSFEVYSRISLHMDSSINN